jgi:amidase
MVPLHDLPAAEAVALLSRRAISAESLVRALLERIALQEPGVRAWAWLDPGLALAQARRIDALPSPPPLAGLPVGVKDIVDTADMPTECGTEVMRGRCPSRDAEVVARLRRAGAVILGKTVTTELAYFRPGETRNPLDPSRTPGGSSSGSAAAVAARMVPAAVGTQTAGSIIRPASFCGVVGMKPTFGLLPLGGVSPFAASLDTLGFLARDPADLPPLLAASGTPLRDPGPAPARLRVGLCRTARWSLAAPESRRALEDAAAALAATGHEVPDADLGDAVEGLHEAQQRIMAFEAARTFAGLVRSHAGQLSPALLDLVRAGTEIPEAEHAEALRSAEAGRRAVARAFRAPGAPPGAPGVDALLTPAAIGEAPVGLAATGDPAFNRLWTLLHLPCLSIPWGTGPSGMPVGVQLVGAHGADLALIGLAGRLSALRRAGP